MQACRNCGHILEENFCPHCGEKKFDKHDLSVRHYVEEAVEGISHFDNKFFRTAKTLLLKPGQLSVDFTEGRRVNYMKPFQFFVIVNLLFFILTNVNPFSIKFQSYYNDNVYARYEPKKIVSEKTSELNMSLESYEKLFNQKLKTNSKSFLFLFIPLFGLLFSLLFMRRRGFAEHLVFATHLVSFLMVFCFLQLYIILLPIDMLSHGNISESALDVYTGAMTLVVIFLYLTVAARRFYQAGWAWAVVSSLLTVFSFIFFLVLFRTFLFFKVVGFSHFYMF